jgi:lipopolysaccharide export system permease protein
MNQIDRLVLGRLASRIGVTVFIFYGLIALVESLDTWRFSVVESERGFLMALLMVAMSAVRWTIKTLPVTVLMGAILGLVDLKMRHELTVIKASGISIWRVLRAPTLVLAAASLVIAIGAETVSTVIFILFRQDKPRSSPQQAKSGWSNMARIATTFSWPAPCRRAASN